MSGGEGIPARIWFRCCCSLGTTRNLVVWVVLRACCMIKRRADSRSAGFVLLKGPQSSRPSIQPGLHRCFLQKCAWNAATQQAVGILSSDISSNGKYGLRRGKTEQTKGAEGNTKPRRRRKKRQKPSESARGGQKKNHPAKQKKQQNMRGFYRADECRRSGGSRGERVKKRGLKGGMWHGWVTGGGGGGWGCNWLTLLLSDAITGFWSCAAGSHEGAVLRLFCVCESFKFKPGRTRAHAHTGGFGGLVLNMRIAPVRWIKYYFCCSASPLSRPRLSLHNNLV